MSKHLASVSLELNEEESESGGDISKFHDAVLPPHHCIYVDDDPGTSEHLASASLELGEGSEKEEPVDPSKS